MSIYSFITPHFLSALNLAMGAPLFLSILLLLSITSITIIIQRALTLKISEVIPSIINDSVQAFQSQAQQPELQSILASKPSPASRILASLLQHASWPRTEALDATAVIARHEVSQMESGLVFLEIITGIAPLLGLMGTLCGLVDIFANLGDQGDPQMVATGISQALQSTVLGLVVALPSLVAYHYFSRKVETLSIKLEAITAQLVSKIYLQK